MYRKRTLETYIKKAALHFPVLLITGARQVGKTTLLQHAASKGFSYVTLDDPLLLSLAREDAALFMQRFPPPLLIDEIQYAPELLPYIKLAVDQSRQPNQFWLTGSQPFHLMQGVSESLAGRVAVIRLLGLSHRELMGQPVEACPFIPTRGEVDARLKSGRNLKLIELFRLIWRGSFPAIVLDERMDCHLFYSSYVQTYLQRDVRNLARVGDEMVFLRFLRAVAARTGQLLNMTSLARDVDIAPNTAKNWLSILQTSGLVYLLEPYHTNITKRMVKAPKLYFLDTGLCAYLTGWSSSVTLEAGAMAGAILETWIIAELLKSYWHNGQEAPFYYYRDKDQKEIDLLILKDGVLHPLEFKKSASPRKEMVRHFKVLDKLNLPVGEGGVICLVEQSLPLSDRTNSIPIGVL